MISILKILLSVILFSQNILNLINENIKALAIVGLFLSLFILLIFAFIRLISSLRKQRKQYEIPKGKLVLTVGYFIIFIGISFFSLSISDDLSSVGSWAAACFFALFIVVLQDFQGFKSEKEIESIYKILIGDSEGFLKQKFKEQQESDSKLLTEIDFLKSELEKVNLENEKLREIKVNLTVTHKRSIISVLENYLTKNSNKL